MINAAEENRFTIYVEYGPVTHMGKYANIGTKLDGIERERDTVQSNIDAEYRHLQNSPSRRITFPRPAFTQTDLTTELVKVLKLSEGLGQARRDLTDHSKNIFGIGVRREKEAALLVRIGRIEPGLENAVKGLHGLTNYHPDLDFNGAFEAASVGRRGVGSEILQIAREVANPRISDEHYCPKQAEKENKKKASVSG
jgi:hypothetical protein